MSSSTSSERRVWNWFSVTNRELLPHAVAVMSGLLILECVLFVSVPAVDSYETSLLAAFPISFWALFYTVLVGGITIMFGAAVAGSPYWRHGLGLVLANYAMYFFFPAARGYKLYGRGVGDILRHLGDVKGILQSGSLPGIWYPGDHMLMAELVMLDVPIDTVPYLVGFLFTTLHITGIGVLVRLLSGRPEGLGIGLAVAAPLVYTELHVSAKPAAISFMLLPVFVVVLELYRRNHHSRLLVLLFLFGLFTVYTHPLTALFSALLVAVTALYSWGHRRWLSRPASALRLRLAAVLPMMLFSWINGFPEPRNTIQKALAQDPAPSTSAAQEASSVSFTVFQLLGKFLTLYGTVATYLLTGCVSAVYLCRELARDTSRYEFGFSTTQFVSGLGLTAVFLLNGLIIKKVVRASRFAMLFAILVIALALVAKVRANDRRFAAVCLLLVLATAVIGVNTAYDPNRQLTHSEYDGTQFVLTNSETEYIYNVKTDNRMEEYVLGSGAPGLYPEQMSNGRPVPKRLGYTDSERTAADTFGDSMLVTKAYDREQHTARYYSAEQQEQRYLYGEESRARLNADSTANKVYANGGFEGWDITPAGGL